MRIGVIGAGPAGLAAALSAAEGGHDVVVLEAAPVVGGMAGSFEVAGVRVDHGSHRLHATTDPVFLRRLRVLLGDDLQTRTRNGRIRLRDRWVAFPLRMADVVRRVPPGFGARVAAETVSRPLRRNRRDSGFPTGDWGDGSRAEPGFVAEVSGRLGPTITDEFYRPYAAKLYGVDPAELTRELARRRVSAPSAAALVAKAVRAQAGGGRTFFYPRRGYGQVAEALADAAVDAGVDLRLGEPVTGVVSGPGPRLRSASSLVEVDVVLSTMPLPALVGALEPPVAAAVGDSVSTLRTRAMILVYLVVPRDRYTPFDAHYFPSVDLAISRLSEPKNYRDGPDPAGRTVLCAELPCWIDDAVWTASDAELAAAVTADLARAGLPDPRAVEVTVRRIPSVYPVYERATAEARAQVERWLEQIPGIATFGRQGLGVPDNLHHVLDMGRAAAAAVGEHGIDRDRWSASLKRFATNVVVD